MEFLVITAVLWIGVHVGIAGTSVRGAAVARLGEARFRIAFSLLSVVTLIALALAYRRSSYDLLWAAPVWLRWILVFAMLPVSVLFVASVATPNPTAVGGGGAAGKPIRGVTRLTRHPMLWAFALWALVHIVGNGDAASLVFFGAFLVTALAGMPSIDAKLAARDPSGWRRLAAETSIVPGAAIVAGRNRLEILEFGWIVPVVGFVLWVLLLFGHRHIIGVAPVPGLPG